MAFLSATELSDMRTHAAATLPVTCTIEYITRASDGMGGWTETWTARGTAIACRLAPARLGTHSDITAERLQEGQTWILSVAYDQALALDDRVTVNGDIYRVQQINADESEMLLKRAYLVRWS